MSMNASNIGKFMWWRANIRGAKNFVYDYDKLMEAFYWCKKKRLLEQDMEKIARTALRGYNQFQIWAFLHALDMDGYLDAPVIDNVQYYVVTQQLKEEIGEKLNA